MARDLLFVCGSGISLDPPACVPGVGDIMKLANDLLLPNDAEDDRAHSALVLNAAQPEVFFEQVATLLGPEFLDIWNVVKKPEDSADSGASGWRPNLNHYTLVSYAARNGVPLVTLNFDTLLEQAAMSLGIAGRVYIPGRRDLAALLDEPATPGRLAVWKVHGCIELTDDRGRSSLHNTMTQIARPNERLLQALARWTSAARVCLVGYSGRDADFFPQLACLLRQRSRTEKDLWIDPQFQQPAALPPGRLGIADRAALVGAECTAEPLTVLLRDELARVEAQLESRPGLLRATGADTSAAVAWWEPRIRRTLPPVSIGERRALLTSLLLHSGQCREAYEYGTRHMAEFGSSLPPHMTTNVLADFARICDWNSKYEQFQRFATEALQCATDMSDSGETAAERRLLGEVAARALLARASHMLMGPFMDWPCRALTHRMTLRQRARSLYLHLRTTIRLRALLLNFRGGRRHGTFYRWLRSVMPLRVILQRDPRERSTHEVLALQYYLDHAQVFLNLVIATLGSLGRPFRRRALDRLEALVNRAGSAYTQADVHLFRFRYGLARDALLARHMWGLVGHPVGLALVARDEGRRLLDSPRSPVALKEAAAKFRTSYEIAELVGNHLTALKAMIGLAHTGERLRKTEWCGHVAHVEGDVHKRFFAAATAYLDRAGLLR